MTDKLKQPPQPPIPSSSTSNEASPELRRIELGYQPPRQGGAYLYPLETRGYQAASASRIDEGYQPRSPAGTSDLQKGYSPSQAQANTPPRIAEGPRSMSIPNNEGYRPIVKPASDKK